MDMFYPEAPVNRRATAVGLDIMPASFGEGFGAAFDDTLTRNPTASLLRALDRARYEGGTYTDEMGNVQEIPAEPSKVLTRDEANAQYGIKGRLTFDADTPEPVAKQLRELKIQEIERQTTMRRANAGIGTALTAGLVGSLLDPLNIASAFVPVVGPARYAALVGRLGVGGARVATGAIEGAVGAALLEPIVYGVAQQEQADYSAVDSVMNIVFGTAIGGGLHLGAGYVGDRIKGRTEAAPLPRAIDNLPTQDQAALLRTAVAQAVEGRAVDVGPVMNTVAPVVAQVSRSDFKLWFGESKVVDDQGAPLVVYHGTPDGDIEFAADRPAFFTSKPRVAEGYTSSRGVWMSAGQAPAVYPVHLSMKNPLVLDALGKRNDNIPVPWQAWKPKVFGNLPKDAVSIQKALDYAKANGYDGLIVKNVVDTAEIDSKIKSDVYAVISPDQIKSAVGNPAEQMASLSAASRAAETPVDAADARAAADVTARTQEEVGPAKPVDDEITRVQEEVTELESYFPEGVEPTQAVKDAAKEATVYEKAWRAAASCLIRKA